jgi:hypothetical protein
MTDQVVTFLIVAVGAVVASVLAVAVLVLSGRAKIGGAARLPEFQRRVPELATLPEDAQIRIVNSAVMLPLLPAVIAILAFLWYALANTWVIDAINGAGRSAGISAVVLLAVILIPALKLQTTIIRWKIRRYAG